MPRNLGAVATTRRRMLAGSAAVILASTGAGCSDVLGSITNGSSSTNADWPMFQSDTANTGHTPAAGPTEEVTARWSVETDNASLGWPAAVVDGTVYVGGTSGNDIFYALDAESGKEQWQADLGGATSPAVVDGTVYVGQTTGGGGSSNGRVQALDAETGDEKWRFPTERVITSSPTVVEASVFIGSHDGHLYALDASTGEERWTYSFDGRVFGTPAVVDGTVYVGDDFAYSDGVDVSRVAAVDAETGEEQWQFDVGVLGSPVVVDDTIYVADHDGIIHALDAATGDRRWHVETDENVFSRTPAVADGTIYVPGGRLHAYATDTGERQWTNDDFIARETEPIVAGDTVYLTGLEGHVYALAADSGEERWSFDVAGLPDRHGMSYGGTSPVIDGKTVYAGGVTGTFYALEEV